MKPGEIKDHWQDLAATYGTDLRATTYAPTLKELEIATFARWIERLKLTKATVLDLGCGNGINAITLAKQFPDMNFHGIDYVPEMIVAANENAWVSGVIAQTQFFVGNFLDIYLAEQETIFTDRCLINLGTISQQKTAISKLADRLKAGGYLLMMENSIDNYAQQNRCRHILGLPTRLPPDYNLFLDETEILPHLAKCGLELLEIDDFISLHDLILYVLIPAVFGDDKKWKYDHPLLQAATKLSKELGWNAKFAAFGQERLYVCQKRTS